MINDKIDSCKSFDESLTQKQIDDMNKQEQQRAIKVHDEFLHHHC